MSPVALLCGGRTGEAGSAGPFYTVAWHEDNKHITEVSHARLVETSYRSPQLTLWTLGPDEWLLFKKLPDYAPCIKRKKLDVIQLPLPDLDENQQQAASSMERQISG